MKFDYTWIMSGFTIIIMWFAGNKNKKTWVLGLINQILWFYLIFDKHLYGLLPMTTALVFIYLRNMRKWNKDN